ncbi:unnamed protein product [Lota lota]
MCFIHSRSSMTTRPLEAALLSMLSLRRFLGPGPLTSTMSQRGGASGSSSGWFPSSEAPGGHKHTSMKPGPGPLSSADENPV